MEALVSDFFNRNRKSISAIDLRAGMEALDERILTKCLQLPSVNLMDSSEWGQIESLRVSEEWSVYPVGGSDCAGWLSAALAYENGSARWDLCDDSPGTVECRV